MKTGQNNIIPKNINQSILAKFSDCFVQHYQVDDIQPKEGEVHQLLHHKYHLEGNPHDHQDVSLIFTHLINIDVKYEVKFKYT